MLSDRPISAATFDLLWPGGEDIPDSKVLPLGAATAGTLAGTSDSLTKESARSFTGADESADSDINFPALPGTHKNPVIFSPKVTAPVRFTQDTARSSLLFSTQSTNDKEKTKKEVVEGDRRRGNTPLTDPENPGFHPASESIRTFNFQSNGSTDELAESVAYGRP